MQQKGIKMSLGILKGLIAVIGIVVCVLIVTVYDADAGNVEDINGSLNNGLWTAYIGLGICALAAVGFGLMHFVENLKSNIPMLAGIGVFIAIILISIYGLADNTVDTKNWVVDFTKITEDTSMYSGGGLIALYIIGAISILTVVYAEVSKALK